VLARQDEITPVLLEFLDVAIINHEHLEDDYSGYLYALYLLAQFREKKAFPLVIKLASLPGKYPEELLGDILSDDLHKIIASVYDGDIVAIQQLIENLSCNMWSRDAGIKSLLALVKANKLGRQWVIVYFNDLFSHDAFKNDDEITVSLVNACCELYPGELYDEIKLAFEQDRVDTDWINMEDVDSVVALGEEACLKKHLTDDNYGLIDDVTNDMRGWHCFKSNGIHEDNDTRIKTFIPEPKSTNDSAHMPYHRIINKVGINELCPCGSGKKHKECCLKAPLH